MLVRLLIREFKMAKEHWSSYEPDTLMNEVVR